MHGFSDNSRLMAAKKTGDAAEAKVLASLKALPTPWQVFNTVEWRKAGYHGEEVYHYEVVSVSHATQ
jgi:hypothetical protein